MAITALPTAPSRARPTEFAAEADTFVAALPTFGTEANALAVDVNAKQVTASAAADTATTQAGNASTSAGTATTKATEAAASALLAENLTESYQGALGADPTLDRHGNALSAGDWYINSVSGFIRAYTGSAWVNGVSALTGVSSVNGLTGAVTGVVDLTTAQTLTNKTLHGNSNTLTVDGANAVGFRHIPQVSQSAAYTLTLTEAGKHILHPSADTTARTFTIPANSAVAFPVGAAITFVNQASAGVVTIAITTDVMRLAGAGTTGSRTLAANGVATAIKLTATEWIISGNGLT